MYRAHCVVIFAIAQLSCKLCTQVGISTFQYNFSRINKIPVDFKEGFKVTVDLQAFYELQRDPGTTLVCSVCMHVIMQTCNHSSSEREQYSTDEYVIKSFCKMFDITTPQQ